MVTRSVVSSEKKKDTDNTGMNLCEALLHVKQVKWSKTVWITSQKNNRKDGETRHGTQAPPGQEPKVRHGQKQTKNNQPTDSTQKNGWALAHASLANVKIYRQVSTLMEKGYGFFPFRNWNLPASGIFSASTWYFSVSARIFPASAKCILLASEKIFPDSKRIFFRTERYFLRFR